MRGQLLVCFFIFQIIVCLPSTMAEPFSFDEVKALARERAAQPYVAPTEEIDPFWRGLDYDQHRQIRFKQDQGLWAAENLPFSLDFFHPGWTANKTIDISEIIDGEDKPVPFSLDWFDYGKTTVPSGVALPKGYAGWRARYRLNSADYMDEFLVHLGASYFRCIPANSPYGLSARGLSINSALPGVAEEFPDFQHFWLERPKPGDTTLTYYALLDGPSVAGAWKFVVSPGAESVIEVEVELTMRNEVTQLGLVPFSSMFWFGELTRPKPYDFRPEVHDSDGLAITLANGEHHFRPLDHTVGQWRHCVYTLDNPTSWSLLQRDRAFHSYQDAEARYHERPGVTVEPVSGLGKGRLHLIEMPTVDEAGDNVVLVWEPADLPKPGVPFNYAYRLKWLQSPLPSGLFQVRASGYGHPVQKPDQLLFTIEYAKPLNPEPKVGERTWDPIENLVPEVTCLDASAKLIHVGLSDLSMNWVDDLPAGLGRGDSLHMPQVLRAFFVIEPTPGTNQLDLTCVLKDESGKPVSEKWLFLWQRP